jgi:hypothetical protein
MEIDMHKGKKLEYHKEYPEAVYKDRVYRWFTDNTSTMSEIDLQKFINDAMYGKLTFQCADEIDIDDPDIDTIDHLLMDIASEKNDELINAYTDEIDWDNDYIEKYNRVNHMNRKYYESLARRIRVLEAMIIEGKRDQEILNNFLGDDYYNKYQLIKNKIKDPEYKDIYKMIKMDPSEVKDYIDNFQSNTDIRRSNKQGATKLYEDDEWVVYRITTYPAAQLYGKNTKWCITGRYEGHEERGEEYFYNYIKNNKLDGGDYFYINKNDPYKKFCVLQKDNGRIHSIWDAGDANMGKSSVDLPTDLPEVEGVNLKRIKTKKDFLIRAINHDDYETIKELVNKGLSPNTVIKKSSALAFAINNDKVHAVKALLECGADADETSAGDWTLIDIACRKADSKIANDIVRLLIKHSSSISNRTFNSICEYCNYITVKTLLDYGYTPNDQTIKSAVEFLSSDTARTVELLLNAGADPNVRDRFGSTVLSDLMETSPKDKETQAIIKTLLDHGAVK